MPFFSVIVPTFNRIGLISRTLESVWSQQYDDYEVIVVDDGSTDGTSEYLQSFRDRLSLFNQSNRGPGAARNMAARHARGEYLAFLDSDDLWFPWSLEVYREIARSRDFPSFIAGKPHRFWKETELGEVVQGPIRHQCFADYLSSGDEWRWWGVSSFVIRRDAFTNAGGFTNDCVNGEDADLALRLGVAPRFVQVTSPATFAYREHELNLVKNLERTLAGVWLKIRMEKQQKYPGGSARAIERRRILTRHSRPVTVDCLRQGLRRDAWSLYRATFVWNAELSRAKYLAGFPVLAVMSKFRTRIG